MFAFISFFFLPKAVSKTRRRESGFSVCSPRSLTVHHVITVCQDGSCCCAAVARQRLIKEPEIRSDVCRLQIIKLWNLSCSALRGTKITAYLTHYYLSLAICLALCLSHIFSVISEFRFSLFNGYFLHLLIVWHLFFQSVSLLFSET